MSTSNSLDFDGNGRELVEEAYRESREYQTSINDQCQRDYYAYRAFLDMTNRDNSIPQIKLPKLFSVIEHKTAQDIKALFGIQPYIPLEANRKELRHITDIQEELLSGYLDRANIYNEAILACKIKTMSGTAFMEFLPDRIMVPEVKMVQDRFGFKQVIERDVPRFRLKCRTFAPWEVFIDPFATNLETPGGCRYIVKMLLVSKRQIKIVQERGGYPDLDLDRLNNSKTTPSDQYKHFGIEILKGFGLNLPVGDDDIGVLMRYESPDRYIDLWNGTETLRDVPNPFIGQGRFKGHGRINLARWPHRQDAHTQNRIWSIGEIKPNEVLADMLDGLWSGIFQREQLVSEPIIFYHERDVKRNDIIWEMGNRIPVSSDSGRPITDSVYVNTGGELPKDRYNLIAMIEGKIDQGTAESLAPVAASSSQSKTAFEISKTSEVGDVVQEMLIRNGEQVFLKSVGELCLGHINQFGTIADYAEVVGDQKAIMLVTANPNAVPGGINYRFRGSDRVGSLLIKQRNLKELAPVLVSLFGAGQFELARLMLEAHEIPQEEIESIIAQNQQLFGIMLGQTGVAGGQPGGKYQENNEQQLASENARTTRGAV